MRNNSSGAGPARREGPGQGGQGQGQKKFYFSRRKFCHFCKDRIQFIDYKNAKVLERYVLETGKILPARVSGACRYHQKQLAKAIKWARHMGLMPFTEGQ